MTTPHKTFFGTVLIAMTVIDDLEASREAAEDTLDNTDDEEDYDKEESSTTSSYDGYGGYFNERSFPVFSGKYRDYPEFKRYWSECVQYECEEPYQRHEILQCVPEVTRPILRNCDNMVDVREILDEEYGFDVLGEDLCSLRKCGLV